MMFRDVSLIRRQRNQWHRPIILGLIVLVFVFAGTAIYYHSRISSLEKELETLQNRFPGSGIVVGAVDMQKIMEESPRARYYQEKLDQKGLEIEEEFEAKAQELEDEDMLHEYQQEAYDLYWEAREGLETQLNEEINQALLEVAEEMGLDLVIARQGIHLGGTDITREVMEKLE